MKKNFIEIQLWILVLLQINIVAKILTSDQWFFYIKNRSLSALWIFFQNFFLICRYWMASFSYILFDVKHPVLIFRFRGSFWFFLGTP